MILIKVWDNKGYQITEVTVWSHKNLHVGASQKVKPMYYVLVSLLV